MHESSSGRPELLRRTLELCRLAKAERLPVTQGRVIDVFRSLATIDWFIEDDFRLAVRTNLAGSRQDEIKFDRLFHAYWHGATADEENYKPWRGELLRADKQFGEPRSHVEMRSANEPFGSEEVLRDLNLWARWDDTAPPLEQVIRELARRLATRPSRRRHPAPKGHQIDLRRSVRRNLRHGMDMIELSWVRRRIRKTRIVVLSDVSGSMDAFNPFLLKLMLGLQRELKNSRTLVFSTQVTEITSLLRRHSVRQTLDEIGATVRHWSGGTDIGFALGYLNRGVLHQGSSRSTVAIIISDGYDNGSPERIARELRVMRRRVRKIVWINPMFGATTFQVRASGMKAALPFIDHFLPAFNAKSLQILVRELARI